RVPLPEGAIVDVTFMVAWPLPFSSDPDASITIRLAASSRWTIFAVPRNWSFTGPILVVTRPLYTSPLTSMSSAPGKQGAIRGTSCMCFHTCSIGAATSNSFSISIDYSLSPTTRGFVHAIHDFVPDPTNSPGSFLNALAHPGQQK